MKYLTVIRHAKTERPEHYPRDFDRELTDRGRKDASRVVGVLETLEPPIEWMLSSTAVRARQTTEIFAQKLKLPHAPVYRDELYAATPDTILDVIAQSPVNASHVAVVAHNPGLEDLVAGLCASAPARVNLIMATTATAHLTLEVAHWEQIRWGCGRLDFLLRPKILRKME